MSVRKTQVAIIGGGPSGMMLSHILRRAGIDNIVLERQSREHVLQRIRAGLLEQGTVKMLRDHGLSDRLDREGSVHNGSSLVWAGSEYLFVDAKKLTGRTMMAFGQTAITEELYSASDESGGDVVEHVENVELHNLETQPSVTYTVAEEEFKIEADYIAGCDGYHGVSRRSIPASSLTEFEKIYPFGWLGIMSETKPISDILYANHPQGFALCSQRNPKLSRYYVQCSADDKVENWSDDRFWEELLTRVGPRVAADIDTGPSIEKSIAPLRSFVAEPMSFGKLYLVGDAAHIVPPTGAKGLNLAFSDVHYLSTGLLSYYSGGGSSELEAYSSTALKRVWGSIRFSWWLTNLMHRFPEQGDIEQRLQEAELEFLRDNTGAQTAMASVYAGLPY